MKKKEFEKTRALPESELTKHLAEAREKLQSLRFDLSLGKVSNVKEVQATRRTIAQLLTLLKQSTTKN